MNPDRVRPRVLFVDDEVRVTQGLRDALRREPYEILCAASGEEGLELLRRGPIDVIVSDEQMPGMPGSVFLGKARLVAPDTVRMLLTGQATLEAAMRAINDGEIYRFFTKPCNHVDLASAIRQGLRQRRLLLLCRQLLDRLQSQQSQLVELEERHPGITHVERDRGGTIHLDDAEADLGELLRDL